MATAYIQPVSEPVYSGRRDKPDTKAGLPIIDSSRAFLLDNGTVTGLPSTIIRTQSRVPAVFRFLKKSNATNEKKQNVTRHIGTPEEHGTGETENECLILRSEKGT